MAETALPEIRPLVGMVHLPALPGAPDFDDRATIHERALADARTLADVGVDALIVENFGDAPFYPDDVPPHVVAEMTAVTRAVVDAVDCPVGVNVLRNDGATAVSVAAAAGADSVRVNVHTGARVADQGIVEGRAHETVRLRDRIDADVAILADVAVEHSAPLAEQSVSTLVADTVERGHADGIVVSGRSTGNEAEVPDVQAVVAARDAVDPTVPVFVGSGVTSDSAGSLLETADGLIVGTALKRESEVTNPVDPDRAAELVGAVH
jgi:membrane complex biogenesis BtpA family protein